MAAMRSLCLLTLLFGAACATPARLVTTSTDTVISVPDAARELAKADVVVLGEMHRTVPVHRMHHELIAEMHKDRPNRVIAMELFERDVQPVLLQYLPGMIDEARFLEEARPWPNYERDYRPVVEFAKENGLLVLAANAPRPLARRVAMKGIGSVEGEKDVARETTAPKDEYWDAFVEAMGENASSHVGSMDFFYEAQCLKDDTMAETIVDEIKKHAASERPLVVLICGRGHSDHRWGTVARICSRMPDLAVRVLSSETVEDLSAGLYTAPKDVADYVVLTEGKPDEPPPPKMPAAAASTEAAETVATAPRGPEKNPEGQRPALGLMPDYAYADGDGVRVEAVRGGGSAELAGIEEGDVIRALGGVEVVDVEEYAEVLDMQIIGKTITVRVRRGDAEVDLQVKVGSRTR
jgi:uncharacterized iron-regulated protein